MLSEGEQQCQLGPALDISRTTQHFYNVAKHTIIHCYLLSSGPCMLQYMFLCWLSSQGRWNSVAPSLRSSVLYTPLDNNTFSFSHGCPESDFYHHRINCTPNFLCPFNKSSPQDYKNKMLLFSSWPWIQKPGSRAEHI